jgi:sugar-phosphatase
MLQLECDAILFDLDGVLIDSSACMIRHWGQWAKHHGLDLSVIMQVAHGIRTVETIQLVAPHLHAEEEARRFTAIEVNDMEDVIAMEGASQLLHSLPSGNWAIVTSGGRELATARLRHTGLPIPDVLVTADDIAHGKPAPEPYLLAAKRLGIWNDRCLVVEDAPAGIEAALSAGMRVIAVRTTHPRQDLRSANAIVEHLSTFRVVVDLGEHDQVTLQIEW